MTKDLARLPKAPTGIHGLDEVTDYRENGCSSPSRRPART